MKLVEEGTLSLDSPAYMFLPNLYVNGCLDWKWQSFTVRDLLQHSAGWDMKQSFDPMFTYLASSSPDGGPILTVNGIVDYVCRNMPIENVPGTVYAYSNIGYALLGRIIEAASGMTYQDFVKSRVLQPMGITRMRSGKVQPRAADEATYYASEMGRAYWDQTTWVGMPYGGFNLEAMDSSGGWVATASDMVRFKLYLDGRRPPAYLSLASRAAIDAKPFLAEYSGANTWYGVGRRSGPGLGRSCTKMPFSGTTAIIVSGRRRDGGCALQCAPGERLTPLLSELETGLYEA